jgi:hypothetical protein
MRFHCWRVILIVFFRAAMLQPLIAPLTGNKFMLTPICLSFVISQHADLYQLSSRKHVFCLLFYDGSLPGSTMFALFFLTDFCS